MTSKEMLFLRSYEIALRCPDGGAEKRISERKSSLEEAPGARKFLFRGRRSAKALTVFLSAKIPQRGNEKFFTSLSVIEIL